MEQKEPLTEDLRDSQHPLITKHRFLNSSLFKYSRSELIRQHAGLQVVYIIIGGGKQLSKRSVLMKMGGKF